MALVLHHRPEKADQFPRDRHDGDLRACAEGETLVEFVQAMLRLSRVRDDLGGLPCCRRLSAMPIFGGWKGFVADWDENRLAQIIRWFRTNLPFPDRVSRSRRPNGHHSAVSWFKSSATEHIAMARELAAILEAHDIRTQMITTARPGYVVYEDDVQVLAEPFRAEHRTG